MDCGSIQEEFSDLGIEVEDKIVLDELEILSRRYNIDSGKISCEYFSFNSKNKLGTKPPTLETILQFENEKLKNLRSQLGPRRPLDPIEGAENLPDCPDLGPGTPARLIAAKRGVTTPEGNTNKRFVSAVGSPVVNISAPSTPSLTQSSQTGAKYSDRTNKGDIVVRHNCDGGQSWESVSGAPVEVKEVRSIKAPYKFMFERMRDTAVALDETICRVADRLIDKYKLVPEDLVDFGTSHSEHSVGIGRVQCDSEGRLNSNSVVLHGSLDSSSGISIPLDLSQATSYSLFPGQVVALDCHNPSGARLVANKLYDGAQMAGAKCSLDSGVTLTVMTACGPFTTTDSTSTEPLEDVLREIEKVKPNVAILIGPFLDLKNNAVTSSDVSFGQQFVNIVRTIEEKVKELETNVYLVSSARDAVGYPVYPQPPFPWTSTFAKNIIPLSDPCVLDIAGVRLAVTSTDVLFHLGKEEISFPPRNGDRMSRLASHLLQQGSMYPLYPPSEDVNLDLERMEQFALLDESPHIMLLPSDLASFVREVGDTTVINPGRLTKGPGPGTFSVFRMRQGEGGKLETSVEITRI